MTSVKPEASKGGQPMQDEPSGDGAGFGGKIIDPTKNVLDLVKAESKYQDGMRDAGEKYQADMRAAGEKFQDFARDAESRLGKLIHEAESRRVDQLANLRQTYETRIADMLRTSVESTSNLVSGQLLSIQTAFNERLSKLEQFRYESSGRAGVADPAMAEAMATMARSINQSAEHSAEALTSMGVVHMKAMTDMAASISVLKATGNVTAGRSAGMSALWGWIAGAVGVAVAVVSFLINLAAKGG